jgi:hypothetical protein
MIWYRVVNAGRNYNNKGRNWNVEAQKGAQSTAKGPTGSYAGHTCEIILLTTQEEGLKGKTGERGKHNKNSPGRP